jgi:putative membrane protein
MRNASTYISENRIHAAVIVALLFHLIGWFGMVNDVDWILRGTPFNLLLMLLLTLWVEENRDQRFWFSFGLLFALGMVAEMIGTNTGLLFGDYQYGSTLGLGIMHVPLVIGINWFLVVFGAHSLIRQLAEKWMPAQPNYKWMRLFAICLDTALLATFFDWIIEPVAMRFDYWSWQNDIIPQFNYLCWFLLALFMAGILEFVKRKPNPFATHLFWIQLLFFLSLRNLS